MNENKPTIIVVDQNPKELRKKIGKKIQRIRKGLGYQSSEVFSYDHNVNRSQFGKYEAGSVDMRLSSLVKAINVLGLTVEEFFSEGLDNNREIEQENVRKP